MKPDDIPDDVWEAAGRALGSPDMSRGLVRKRVGRAILAERERCAKIVALYADHPNEVVGMAADEIYTAIHAAETKRPDAMTASGPVSVSSPE